MERGGVGYEKDTAIVVVNHSPKLRNKGSQLVFHQVLQSQPFDVIRLLHNGPIIFPRRKIT